MADKSINLTFLLNMEYKYRTQTFQITIFDYNLQKTNQDRYIKDFKMFFTAKIEESESKLKESGDKVKQLHSKLTYL